jgi:uncharacterized protein YihD (DUF1040 family)
MRLNELLQLLKDDQLVWSADFESIRKPFVKLLTKIEQTDSHQFDEELDELTASLLDG